MFTKYSDIFIEVQKRMKNNQAVRNCLPFINIRKAANLENIDFLISQVIFETLSTLEDKKILDDIKNDQKTKATK